MRAAPAAALIVWRSTLRPLLRRPRSSLLSVLSIALGVAVFLSVTIANRSAAESFRRAFQQVTGLADLEIRGTVPEEILPAVQAMPGVAAATPLVEALVTLPDHPGETLHLVGVDPFSAHGLLSLQPGFGAAGGGHLGEWLRGGEGVAVTPGFLSRHRLAVGDRLRLQGAGAPRSLRIRFVIGGSEGDAAGDRIAALDLAAAQEWVGRPGELTAILLRLTDVRKREDVVRRLREMLPADVSVEPPARRTERVEAMLSAFRLNLTALSLVSLLVGMFFVGNAAAAAVMRQQVSLGILRAAGTGRPLILGTVFAEAGVCGLVGSLLGILAAPLLAGVLAAPVATTVSSLYLPVEARGGWPSVAEATAGILAGVGAALLAAWIPARQAAAVDPTRVLHPGAAPELFPLRAARLALLGAGLLLLAAATSLWALHGGPALLGFAAAFCVLAGFSLAVPLVTDLSSRGLRRLLVRREAARGTILRLALEQTQRALHRTAPTIAALAAAVAMTVGISVMIHSFRGSVVAWTERTLNADLFIAPAANELLGLAHTLPDEAAAWWNNRPGIRSVGTFREFEARTPEGVPVTLGAVSGRARGEIDFLHGGVAAKTEALRNGRGVALSESLGRRLGLGPGSALTLQTPRGAVTLPVLDLYRDYTRDRGIALLSSETFRALWSKSGVHSLAIEFVPGTPDTQREALCAEFLAAFGGREAAVCYGNRALRQRIAAIFDQTFAVTAVLRTIAIAVAVGGVLLTLGLLVLERARDLGVLRAIGASAGQILRVVLAEAAVIGLIASGVGLVSGAALSLVLTWVINKAFFGWSIDLAYPWGDLAVVPLWMTAAALAAGALPARRAAATPPAAALRAE